MQSKVPTLFNLALKAVLNYKNILENRFSTLPQDIGITLKDLEEVSILIRQSEKAVGKYEYRPYLVWDKNYQFGLYVKMVDTQSDYPTPIQKLIARYKLTIIENEVKIISLDKEEISSQHELTKLSEYLEKEIIMSINNISPKCLPPKEPVINSSHGPCL